MPDYIYMLETRLSPEQQRAVSTVQDVARVHEMNVYLTGGAVRDLTSGFPIRDLDFSVQGNALKLQKELQKSGMEIQGVEESPRALFLVGSGGVRVEVSSTRSETFPKPGKPEYGPANMLEDLRRRDFTINAMALSLNPGSRGLLMDPFNGVADIESKLLRILHNYAFLEDPSRLIRATRFAARFQWTLEEKTQARYNAAKENDYIGAIGHYAVGYELEEIAHEEDPLQTIKVLEKEGWMQHLYPAWASAKADVPGLHEVVKTRQQLNDLGITPDPSTANLHFLTAKLGEKDVRAIQKLFPRPGFVKEWQALESDAKDLSKQLLGRDAATPSQTWSLLMTCKPEALLFLDITTKNSAVQQKLKNFLTKWPLFRQKLPYQTMTEMRITPDLPIYKGLLDEMFLLLLDGKLRTQQEIVKFLEPHSPPLPPPPQPMRRGRAAKKSVPKKKAPERAAAQPVVAAATVSPVAVAVSPSKPETEDRPKPGKMSAAKPKAEKVVAEKPKAEETKPEKPAEKPKVVAHAVKSAVGKPKPVSLQHEGKREKQIKKAAVVAKPASKKEKKAEKKSKGASSPAKARAAKPKAKEDSKKKAKKNKKK